MKNRLILVEGIPGTGKSTLAQYIAIQLEKNNQQVKWIHECQDDHFFWNEVDDCFAADEYFFRDEGEIANFMSLNLKLWEKLVKEIEESAKVYVIEGYFFAQLANTLFRSDQTIEEIIKYMQEVAEIIKPLNPLLVDYFVKDPESHTIKTWDDRAQWAKELVIKNSEKVPFVKRKELKGEAAIGYEQQTIQEMNTALFDTLTMDKLRIDISNRDYISARAEVLHKLGLKSYNYLYEEKDLKKYCGHFLWNDDHLIIKILDNKLVCDWGQQNMALLPLSKDTLSLRSYPVYLKFTFAENGEATGIKTSGEPIFRRVGGDFKKVSSKVHIMESERLLYRLALPTKEDLVN